MLRDNLSYNAKVTPDSDFLSELKSKLPAFFVGDSFDLEKFKKSLETENIQSELTSGYQLDFIGKNYAKKMAGEAPQSVVVPNTEHNAEDINKDSRNLFFTGDNLEVLRHLQVKYENSIDVIYIDPPYNTGNDGFVYPDSFAHSDDSLKDMFGLDDEALARLKAIQGKSTHSAWLTFMYPRLKLAYRLLKDTGVIFVSIDDNEQANLKLLMDEIYGEGQFVANIMWKRKKEVANDSKNVSIQGENILVYSRTTNVQLSNEPLSERYIKNSYNNPSSEFPLGKWRPVPITVSKGLSGGGYEYAVVTPSGKTHNKIFAYPKNSYEKLLSENRIYFGVNGDAIPQRVIYDFESKGQPTTNYWENTTTNKEGKKEIIDLFQENIFTTPKPTKLLLRLLNLIDNPDATILDFFAGSATTADAVMQLNAEDGGSRSYIMVQLPEPTFKVNSDGTEHAAKGAETAYKAGYRYIDEISRERIKRASQKIQDENPNLTNFDAGFKHYQVVKPQQKLLEDLETFDVESGGFYDEAGNLLLVGEDYFDDMLTPFSARKLGVEGSASAHETIMATWKLADGYFINAETQTLDFSGYEATLLEKRLYLIDAGWTEEQTRQLVNLLGTGQLILQSIVIYGYSFDTTKLRELEIALNQLDKPNKVNLIKRY